MIYKSIQSPNKIRKALHKGVVIWSSIIPGMQPLLKNASVNLLINRTIQDGTDLTIEYHNAYPKTLSYKVSGIYAPYNSRINFSNPRVILFNGEVVGYGKCKATVTISLINPYEEYEINEVKKTFYINVIM